MIIFGIGTDIISINRIKNSLKKKNFINRIFNEKEILKCKRINNSINCYAKRFAAKEAFSKALGTGISNGINFNEIVILNKNSGKPYINIIGQTKKVLDKKFKRKKIKISLSISDEKKYAVAFVTISL
jgi:holo-[acyl-carrier protein] synthase|tara:strand:+ start:524 stop:907 length:384 start_codon:yes stop_codon:yes gene_type:complete